MVRVFVVVGQMYQTWRRPRTHHLRPSPSRTLLGNEQTAGFLRWHAGYGLQWTSVDHPGRPFLALCRPRFGRPRSAHSISSSSSSSYAGSPLVSAEPLRACHSSFVHVALILAVRSSICFGVGLLGCSLKSSFFMRMSSQWCLSPRGRRNRSEGQSPKSHGMANSLVA